MPFVEFNNVTFGYKEDDYLLLEDLSFSVEKNDIITVIGASGCGKSTLFRLMTCLETAAVIMNIRRFFASEFHLFLKPFQNAESLSFIYICILP